MSIPITRSSTRSSKNKTKKKNWFRPLSINKRTSALLHSAKPLDPWTRLKLVYSTEKHDYSLQLTAALFWQSPSAVGRTLNQIQHVLCRDTTLLVIAYLWCDTAYQDYYLASTLVANNSSHKRFRSTMEVPSKRIKFKDYYLDHIMQLLRSDTASEEQVQAVLAEQEDEPDELLEELI